MLRPLLPIGLILAWMLGFAFLGLAWGAEGGDPASVITVPGPGAGTVSINIGDLTFPGAVVFGFWMLARALPPALRSWTPTIRVELVRFGRERGDVER